MASLITIIETEPMLLLRVLRWSDIPEIGRAACTCKLISQLISHHMGTIMDSIGRAAWSELLLIKWRVRTGAPLRSRGRHEYPHIRRALQLDASPQYRCVTINLDHNAFYLYESEYPQITCASRVRLWPTTSIDWMNEPTIVRTPPEHDLVWNEHVIFGGCWCKICQPVPLTTLLSRGPTTDHDVLTLNEVVRMDPSLLLRIIEHTDLITLGRLSATCTLMATIIRRDHEAIMKMPIARSVQQTVRLIGHILYSARDQSAGRTALTKLDYSALRQAIVDRQGSQAPTGEYACVTAYVYRIDNRTACMFWGYVIRSGVLVYERFSCVGEVLVQTKQFICGPDIHKSFDLACIGECVLWGGCPCDECTQMRMGS